MFVIVTFDDGSRIGGFFGSDSYVSNYPEQQEIYLQETYVLDEDGRFLDASANPKFQIGCLIDFRKVRALEIIQPRRRENLGS